MKNMKNNEAAVVTAFVKALPKPLKNAVKKRSVYIQEGNIVVSRTMTLDPCDETNWNLTEQFVDGRYEPELDRYVYEINSSFYETPEYAQFLRRNRLHTTWPVQEGADIDLYYEDPYARANVELFFYSHYTVPLDALDVRSARKAAKRFAAGC